MFDCYAEMDELFGQKPNVTPISGYDLQEKDSLNCDDDDIPADKVPVENLQDESKSKSTTHSTQKSNQALSPSFSEKSGSRERLMVVFAPTYANFLQSWQKAHETSDNACLEWDRERWHEEKVRNMEKQHFEQVKLQKQMEFDKKQHTKKYEFEKRKVELGIGTEGKEVPDGSHYSIIVIKKANCRAGTHFEINQYKVTYQVYVM
ncbi:hypothetical protein O181_047941 [Austropuccinia psidii MF-1]|uniref:Uncharacterized protein n=1 Tax=Austropuccinia psidii MF-1 TaxID=1389203 RepID=A0A9Q3HJY1_9BASI|nr:hypothetical protein [Austropuccinia psidii MF-1]